MTRLLLDTQLVLWWLNGDPQLPQAVLEPVQAPEADLESDIACSSAKRSALSARSRASTSSRMASGQRWRQGSFFLGLTAP